MTGVLLATKLAIPPLPEGLIARPQLVERLSEAVRMGQRISLICAPAGYGKSAILRAWVAQASTEISFAWLALDADDNDPDLLRAYLAQALCHLASDTTAEAGTRRLNRAQNTPDLSEPEILIDLLNQINQRSRPAVLILDDYQFIDHPAAQATVRRLLEHLPPTLHLAVATRNDPSLGLGRLRASGQVNELRTGDLAFSEAETAVFFNQQPGLRLTTAAIQALWERTEGWPAGLRMAALSLKGHPNPAAFIQHFSGSQRYVLAYLVEEILSQQPATIQTFLLKTSVLDRLCADLCDMVLGGESDAPGKAAQPIFSADFPSSQAVLAYLERANLFLLALEAAPGGAASDAGTAWYRYHHLFADLLRAQLHQTYPGLEDRLKARAAQWYAENQPGCDTPPHGLSGGQTPLGNATRQDDVPDGKPAQPYEPLSTREKEVLHLVCQGWSNQAIADHLVVSLNTIKKHNLSIFRKLGVTNRAQAILAARQMGLERG